MMSGDASTSPGGGGCWFQRGTHSLWLYDREGRGQPALLAVYEWELAGLRGVCIEAAWGDLGELKSAKGDWDVDYKMLLGEVIEQEQLSPLHFAELVATGHMHRIGAMPRVDGFSESPIGLEKEREPGKAGDPHAPA
jgi:hypothetical protein